MAEGKKSFVLYSDITSTVKKIIEKDRINGTNNSGELFYHILMYVSDENPEPINDTIDLVFEPIKMQLKRDLTKWETRSERSRENGKKGGRPSTNNIPEKPEETQQVILEPIKPDSVSVSVSDINIINTKTRYESYMTQSLEDEIWKETFLVKRQLTLENFPFALKDYNIHLLQQAESKKSLNDYKRHFANWVTKVKQIKSSKNDT